MTYLANVAIEDGGADADRGDGLDGLGLRGNGGIVDIDITVPRGGGQVVGHGRPAQGRDGVGRAWRKGDRLVLLALVDARGSEEGFVPAVCHVDDDRVGGVVKWT